MSIEEIETTAFTKERDWSQCDDKEILDLFDYWLLIKSTPNSSLQISPISVAFAQRLRQMLPAKEEAKRRKAARR